MKYIVVCHPKVKNKYYVCRQGIGMHYVMAEAMGEDIAKQIADKLNVEFQRNEEVLTAKPALRSVKKKAA